MGFTTGLLGGFTLTTAVIYFSLSVHAKNRAYQSSLLQQQTQVLGSFVDPKIAGTPPQSREVHKGLVEEAKDRWNRELESNIRKLYETDWTRVRERAEDTVAGLWERGLEKSREALPDAKK